MVLSYTAELGERIKAASAAVSAELVAAKKTADREASGLFPGTTSILYFLGIDMLEYVDSTVRKKAAWSTYLPSTPTS